jgi:dihydrofolate reductase
MASLIFASNVRYVSTFRFFPKNGNVHIFPTSNKNVSLTIRREKNLRKIIVTTWISLDGFLAGPNGEMNWVMVDQAMGQYEDDLVSSADTLILGRVTYQSFAGSWPHVPDNPSVSEGEREYARKLNSMRKIVFSKSLEKAEWNNSQLVREVLPQEIAGMKQESGKDMVIYGSASIVQAFTNLGLIDEYQLLVHPIVLGSGKPLFAGIAKPAHLRLLQTKSFPSGVIGLYYAPQSK